MLHSTFFLLFRHSMALKPSLVQETIAQIKVLRDLRKKCFMESIKNNNNSNNNMIYMFGSYPLRIYTNKWGYGVSVVYMYSDSNQVNLKYVRHDCANLNSLSS